MQPSEAERVAELVALREGITPDIYRLSNSVCVIGRSPSCTLIVPGQLISRMHARVEPNGPRYQIADASSANGTFVNGRRIHGPYLLSDQDEIGLGAPTPLLRFFDPDPTSLATSVLQFDERTMSFRLGGSLLELTPAQFRLLHYLYRNAGQVCSRESCAQALWGRDYEPGMDAGALDQAFNSLRRALRQVNPLGEDLIQTRRGLGYELVL